MTSSLVVDEELVHVGYAEEREDLLVLALPASKASAKEVAQVVRDTVRVLRLKYKTLFRAFNQKNESALNELFSVLFLDILLDMKQLSGQGRPVLELSTVLAPAAARFQEKLPAAQLLQLPEQLKFQIDDALSQLESADFQEHSPDFYDAPREFNILGTCLFHKGFLVASHLPRDDMVDVLLWGEVHQVLPLTRLHPLQQLVSWTEVYPTTRSRQGPPHSLPDTRWFLLLVGLGYQVLAVLLETGGGAATPTQVVRPDPFYVDQALKTLESLVDMGIPLVCNKWLTLPSNPDILNLDDLIEAASTQKRLDSSTLATLKEDRISAAGIILKKTKNYEYSSTDSPSGSLEESVSLNHSQVRSTEK